MDEITKLTQLCEQELGPSSRVQRPAPSGYPNRKATKKSEDHKVKKSRPSLEVQRFIERKKRDQQMKKSLELTIEIDKQ